MRDFASASSLFCALLLACSGSGSNTPPDTTPPTVMSTGPANMAHGVSVGRELTVSFSEALRPESVNEQTFTVQSAAGPVTGSVQHYGSSAVFTPARRFAFATDYTATLSTGIQDLAGNALAAPFTWRFTTAAATDTTPPTLASTSPIDGATGVPTNASIALSFSKAIDPASVGPQSVILSAGGSAVTGVFATVASRVTFRPAVALTATTAYTLTLTRGLRDTAGNTLAADQSLAFTTGAFSDSTPPTVVATNPASGLTGVAQNVLIAATFSEEIDTTTLDATTFQVSVDGAFIAGVVSYGTRRATFSPGEALRPNALYTAALAAGIKDLSGNALVPATWTFTTGPNVDTTPPTVTTTSPARDAAGVAPNTAISATFSKAMDSTTLSATTINVTAGTTPIPGAIAYANGTVTFTPHAPLRASTRYTTRIGTGARDLAGNGLPETYGWSFSTGSAPDTTPPRVSSTSPAEGDALVSVARALTVVFSEPVDPTTVTSTSVALFDGAMTLPCAQSLEGSVVTLRPAVSLASDHGYELRVATTVRDLAGNALASAATTHFHTAPDTTPPRVVGTLPSSDASDVAPSTAIEVTFSEPLDAASAPNALQLTAGGAPLPGTTSVTGATLRFQPSAALQQDTLHTVTLTTALRDLAGNALSVPYTWRFATSPDRTPPTVATVLPGKNATGVSTGTLLRVNFSKAMDAATLDASSFTLADAAGALVALSVGYDGRTLTAVPTAPLRNEETYTATLAASAADLAGNHLQAAYAWSFTTAPDTFAPTIASTFPADGALGVDLGASVRITFSEPMDVASLRDALTVSFGLVPVPGTVDATSTSVTFTPTSGFGYASTYEVVVSSAATDLAGNALAADARTTFTTVADPRPPTLVSSDPANGATGVATDAVVTATFSRSMDEESLNPGSFFVVGAGQAVAGVVVYDDVTKTARFYANGPWALGTAYLVTLSSAVRDAAGNALASPVQWSFTTIPDTTPPTIVSVTPQNGAALVPTNTTVTATFSKPLDPGSVNPTTFTLTHPILPGVPHGPIATNVLYAGGVATLTPVDPLLQGVSYTATLSGVSDLAGNVLATSQSWTFRTIPDTTPPSIRARNPEPGATGVPLSILPRVAFSEPVDQNTINVTLWNGTTQIPTNLVKSASDFSIYPQAILDYGAVYTLRVTGVQDLAGNALADFSWTFTTVLDTTPPSVVSVNPGSGATGVPLTQILLLQLSEPLDPTTVPGSFTLTSSAGAVPGTLTYTPGTIYISFTPTSLLNITTLYTATLGITAKDVHGNALSAPYSWSFTTRDRAWGTTGLNMNPASIFVSPVPSLVSDGANNVFVLWSNRTCPACSDDVYIRRYIPGPNGGTLFPPAQLTTAGASVPTPVGAASSNGTNLVAWVQFRTSRYGVATSRMDPSTGVWGAPVFVDNNLADPPTSGVGVDNWRPALTANGSGMIAWGQRTSGINSLWFNRMSTTGVFSGPVQLANSSGSRQATDPRLALDASGNALLVYREFDGTVMQVMARKWNASTLAWSAPEAVSNAVATIGNLSLAMNATGTGMVSWTQTDGTEGLAGLWTVRRIGPVLTGSWGALREIDTVPTVDGGPSPLITQSQLAVNATGDAFAVWMRGSTGLFARYGTGVGWSSPVSYTNGANYISVTAGPNGSAFVGYTELSLSYGVRYLPATGLETTGQQLSPYSGSYSFYFLPQIAYFADGSAAAFYASFAGVSPFYYGIQYNEYR